MDRLDFHLLYIDTATEVCSVAISLPSGEILVREEKNNEHIKYLNEYIRSLFVSTNTKVSNLAGVVVSEGPGSYTSLRVGLATAKGLCLALKIPLILVPTLESIAVQAIGKCPNFDNYLALMDARRKDVFAAVFDVKASQSMNPELITLDSLTGLWTPLFQSNSLLCGNGAIKWKEIYPKTSVECISFECSAQWLIKPGMMRFVENRFNPIGSAVPFYLKDPNITTPGRNAIKV